MKLLGMIFRRFEVLARCSNTMFYYRLSVSWKDLKKRGELLSFYENLANTLHHLLRGKVGYCFTNDSGNIDAHCPGLPLSNKHTVKKITSVFQPKTLKGDFEVYRNFLKNAKIHKNNNFVKG